MSDDNSFKKLKAQQANLFPVIDCRAEVKKLFLPSAGFSIGIELEFFTSNDDGTRPTTQRLHDVLDSLVLPNGGRITLEPGSQVELSTAPFNTIAKMCSAMKGDLNIIFAALEQANIHVLPISGIDTSRRPQRMEMHSRYRLLEERFDTYSKAGRWMMNNTASLQVNINNCESQPLTHWQLLWRVNPLLTAIFSNSAGRDTQGRAWSSLRQGIWRAMDPTLTGPVQYKKGAEGYHDFALDASILLVKNNSNGTVKWDEVPVGTTFRDWIMNPNIVGRPPNKDDLAYHLTTFFPDIRAKGWMELRSIDMVELEHIETVATLIAAISIPEATNKLLKKLPEISPISAARYGLQADPIAEAVKILFEVAIDVVENVPGAKKEVLENFFSQYSSRRKSPITETEQQFAPDLSLL